MLWRSPLVFFGPTTKLSIFHQRFSSRIFEHDCESGQDWLQFIFSSLATLSSEPFHLTNVYFLKWLTIVVQQTIYLSSCMLLIHIQKLWFDIGCIKNSKILFMVRSISSLGVLKAKVLRGLQHYPSTWYPIPRIAWWRTESVVCEEENKWRTVDI